MKARSFGRHTGFSTLELMIAFAIMSIVMSGVVIADFSANYWTVAAQTSNEGLYKAKTRLEELRAAARQDFFLASSSSAQKDADASCASGSLCYFVESVVTDLSPCSKYAQAKVDWQVQGYPTTTASLFTHLTDPAEAVMRGGDCPLAAPPGRWTGGSIAQKTSEDWSGDSVTGIDTLSGTTYLGTDAAPYFRIVTPSGLAAFKSPDPLQDPIASLDAARDLTTERTYVYAAVASTTGQLAIIDATDPLNPALVSSFTLPGMTYPESEPQKVWGRKIVYYDHTVYLTTRDAAGPELHIIDVSVPAAPRELGSKELGFTVLDMAVRDEYRNGSRQRVLYAATGRDTGEIAVINLTSLSSISVSSFDIPDTNRDGTLCALAEKPDAISLYALGARLFVGREHSADTCPLLPDLYILDISDPSSPVVLASGIGGGGITGLYASGDLLFAQVSALAQPGTKNGMFGLKGLIDLDGSYVYAGTTKGNTLQTWSADPAHFEKIGAVSVSGGPMFQVFKSD